MTGRFNEISYDSDVAPESTNFQSTAVLGTEDDGNKQCVKLMQLLHDQLCQWNAKILPCCHCCKRLNYRYSYPKAFRSGPACVRKAASR